MAAAGSRGALLAGGSRLASGPLHRAGKLPVQCSRRRNLNETSNVHEFGFLEGKEQVGLLLLVFFHLWMPKVRIIELSIIASYVLIKEKLRRKLLPAKIIYCTLPVKILV